MVVVCSNSNCFFGGGSDFCKDCGDSVNCVNAAHGGGGGVNYSKSEAKHWQ